MGTAGTPSVTSLDLVQKYVNTANHMLIAIVSSYTTWMCWQMGPTSISLHTWLCTIGYQFLMCEAIMSLYQHNSWSAVHTRSTQMHLHWILQALGVGMIIAGMIVFFATRDEHLVSLHACLGLAAGVFTVIGALNGITALWARELFRWVKPVYTKLFHTVVGVLAFVLGMVSLVYGFNTLPVRLAASAEVIVALQTMCGVTIVLSLIGAGRSLVRLVQGALPGWCYREDISDDEEEVVDVPTIRPRAEGKMAYNG